MTNHTNKEGWFTELLIRGAQARRNNVAMAVRANEAPVTVANLIDVRGDKVRAEEYAPYHTMKAFQDGEDAFLDGPYLGRPALPSPYGVNSVDAQAWDRGYEFAMRASRSANDERRLGAEAAE